MKPCWPPKKNNPPIAITRRRSVDGFDTVRVHRLNHMNQTYDFSVRRRPSLLQFNRRTMTPWDALDYLNTLVDDSDPTSRSRRLITLIQTGEAMRANGEPEWMVLTGFVHDLWQSARLFGEPQWAVVGDTFPTGCAYSNKVVWSEFFALNPDMKRPESADEVRHVRARFAARRRANELGHDEYLITCSSPTCRWKGST